jgi:predicted HTH domain antitoxin
MQSKVVRTLALALLLGSVGMTAAQQPGGPPGSSDKQPGGPQLPGRPLRQNAPAEKSKLEEMLAEALKNNPDIRVAAAKLAEAEAELNRARVQVTQQVATLYQGILSQKAVVEYAQKRYDRMKGLLADRAIDAKLVEEESDKLMAAKAKLAELEAQMPGLLGKTTRTEDSASDVRIAARLALELTGQQPNPSELYRLTLARAVANPHKTTGPMAERLRKALQTPVKVGYTDGPLPAFLDDLMKKAPGLSIRCSPHASYGKVRLHFEEPLPVTAVLQALEDDFNLRFIVREYGILVPDPRVPLPPGALTVEEFLRQKPVPSEHKEAQHFIHDVWPKLKPESLEDSIPTAQKAFQTCMDVGDRDSIRALLGMTLGHLNRLQKRLSELHPELAIDDEKEAQRLKKVGEKLGKLGVDIQNCLKNWER